MPRERRDSAAGRFHHIYARGNRRQSIFGDDDDRVWFLRRLKRLESETGAVHLAHCLMPNHVHIVVRPGSGGISRLMHRLLSTYARWYNTRHGQVGHLFQDRFGSRPIHDDLDLVWLLRYVHRNPVEAGLVERPADWPWSSHRDHLRISPPGYLAEGARVLRGVLAEDTQRALSNYRDAIESSARSPVDISSVLLPMDALQGASAPELSEATRRPASRLLDALARRVARRHHLRSTESLAGTSRGGRIMAARRAFCREAIRRNHVPVRDVSIHLGRSPSTIWRWAGACRRVRSSRGV